MRLRLVLALLFILPAAGQVPTGATPITITQVNTLAGIRTWTFHDPAGNTYFIQSPVYLVANIPGGASATLPIAAPGLWIVPATQPAPPATTASPDLTAITNNTGTIIDAAGNKWTIVNNQVMLNGAAAGYTSGVVKLVIVKGVIWQENSANGWWYWNTTAVTWDGGAAPI
jgi:hypothetical protein